MYGIKGINVRKYHPLSIVVFMGLGMSITSSILKIEQFQ